jgi:hypothetical protein
VASALFFASSASICFCIDCICCMKLRMILAVMPSLLLSCSNSWQSEHPLPSFPLMWLGYRALLTFLPHARRSFESVMGEEGESNVVCMTFLFFDDVSDDSVGVESVVSLLEDDIDSAFCIIFDSAIARRRRADSDMSCL